MRIAYVEDNAINLALVQRIAMMSGHVITSYTEGETALVGLSQETYDLIMMDVELAGELNGLDVVRALRAHGLTTPIIAVTAYAMRGDREKCLEAGCNDYLPKPLPIADFLALLAHYDTLLQAQKQPVIAVPVLKTNVLCHWLRRPRSWLMPQPPKHQQRQYPNRHRSLIRRQARLKQWRQW